MGSLNPAKYTFTIWKGADFDKRLTLYSDAGITLWNLTGYTGDFLIKDKVGGTTLLDLTTGNGGLILGGAGGTVDITIPLVTVNGLTWAQGTYTLTVTSSVPKTSLLLHGNIRVRSG